MPSRSEVPSFEPSLVTEFLLHDLNIVVSAASQSATTVDVEVVVSKHRQRQAVSGDLGLAALVVASTLLATVDA